MSGARSWGDDRGPRAPGAASAWRQADGPPSKQSGSKVKCSIFACSAVTSHTGTAAFFTPPSQTGATPTKSWSFHCLSLVRMHVERLSEFRQRLFPAEGGQRHLGLQSRAMVSAWSSRHDTASWTAMRPLVSSHVTYLRIQISPATARFKDEREAEARAHDLDRVRGVG